MNEALVLDVFNTALMTILKVSLPVLTVSLVVGLVISVLQATTQIQEQTLSFVPKLAAVFLSLVVFGSFMLSTLVSFTQWILAIVAEVK
ncbi:flagellar biosynthesis protein FliQ [Acidaminobacter hydrogenoformans]|uniref:Flagellar biosynthetic protein FliQ n=1 Tax=Acidaminobacter hydrogenoformans DSM 2784 TaxID=1120920 RepID=A0A1G5RUP5_9FIRM|nr:flagellar biosynthesis protein FliQ [Acidaminobacter hydrogenoformans]SCZ77773.1 flagellar biosynthetic protein FliQ [Acidaminobacter hydrogenoformans DSM 2784]